MPFRYQQELATLISGYQRFRDRYYSENEPLFRKLASQGQKPKTMLISCSDSRVDPTIIMGTSPGEIFAVRNVANLVPAYKDRSKNEDMGAALEFAVKHLKVEHIIVMGHSQCGGIKTLLETNPEQNANPTLFKEKAFIQDWVNIAKEAKDKVLEEYKDCTPAEKAQHCEEQALLLSLTNLLTYPQIKNRVQEGKLALHAWRFDISQGLIQCYNPESKKFEDLNANELERNAAPAQGPIMARL